MITLKNIGYALLAVSILVLSYVVVRYCTINKGRGNGHRYAPLRTEDYELLSLDDRKLWDERVRLTGLVMNKRPTRDELDRVIEPLIRPDNAPHSEEFTYLERENQFNVDSKIISNFRKKLARVNVRIQQIRNKKLDK